MCAGTPPAACLPRGRMGYRGTKCAKRTQFRRVARASLRLRSQGRLCPWVRIMGARAHATVLAAGIPHHSTILSFHHPHPISIVQNEPNLACHCGLGGRRVQNEPNWPGPIAQNEPNLAWRRGRRRRNVQNEPNFALWDEGQMRKTNPISPAGPTEPPRGPIVRNKANWPPEGVGRGRPTLDQVEGGLHGGPGPIVQNEANLPGGARWDEAWGLGRGANAQNEPNFRRPRYPTIPLFHSSNPGVRRAFCLPRRPAADIMLPESSLA